MKLGRVVGTVVTPVQHPAYDGRRLLAVRPILPDGRDAKDRLFIAVDRCQAAGGAFVMCGLRDPVRIARELGGVEIPVDASRAALIADGSDGENLRRHA